MNPELSTLFLDYLRVLIWPVLVLFLVFRFRREISEFIDRIYRVKFPGGEVEAETQKDLQESEEEFEDAEEFLAKDEELLDEMQKEYETKYAELEQNSQKLIQELSLKDLQLEFERMYHVIFGSQLRLLDLLSAKPAGVDRQLLASYYAEVQKAHPGSFTNWPLEQYLQFLLTRKLIELGEHGRYRLTEKGSSFLSYLANLKYPKDKEL